MNCALELSSDSKSTLADGRESVNTRSNASDRSITIECFNCSKNLRIPSDKKIKFTCPDCGHKMISDFGFAYNDKEDFPLHKETIMNSVFSLSLLIRSGMVS